MTILESPGNGHRHFCADRDSLNEAETEAFAKAIAADPKRLISAFNLLEAAIVIEAKKGEAGGIELDLLVHRARIEIVDMSYYDTPLSYIFKIRHSHRLPDRRVVIF